ncbi:UNVERIFIED_CONTAM: hypothetical protein HDU68_001902 [Siphonaria sp. JEL0065]|nr:hypothetical protein HDU68_001902 [Siphonaria sp. JEL0065]
MGIMDSIVKEQTENIQSVVVEATTPLTNDTKKASSVLLSSIPSIPDMGIKKRFSMLTTTLVGSKRQSDTPVSLDGDDNTNADVDSGRSENEYGGSADGESTDLYSDLEGIDKEVEGNVGHNEEDLC